MLLPAPGPQTVPVGMARGIRMQVDFGLQTRTFLGLYEVELNRYLRSMLVPGATAFDIGVQYGYDALVIAKRTGARVAAFERDQRWIDSMTSNFALNPGLGSLITPVIGTVGDGPGEVGLDAWAYSAGFAPDFIKLDIDGGELAALRSARRLLTEHRPSLIVETHSLWLEQECGRLLLDAGYTPVIVNQRRLWPDLRPTDHNRWLVAGGARNGAVT
jgi:hypothetical protein